MTTIAREGSQDEGLEEGATARRIRVIGGVDTHADTHIAAVVDASGRLLGHQSFPATASGYAACGRG